MIACDRQGHFRARIESYGLREEASGAVGITLQVKLLEILDMNGDEPQWLSWAEYNMECTGTIYIIKRYGKVNQVQAESLMRYAGWDGNFDSIVNEKWDHTDFSCSVEPDVDKNGKQRGFRVGFINDWNYMPGARSNVDATKAREIQSKHGSALRAIAANVKRNVPSVPSSRPTAPPPPMQLADPPLRDGEIPF